ncbi:hypothetical protein C0995_013751 [Termitomyces sp. Mi166|nr:hypothetical protein C0995_013751 [Termitomyces sp. Mi166\
MHLSSAFIATVVFILPVLAVLNPHVTKPQNKATDRFIVSLKDGVSRDDILRVHNINALHNFTSINGFATKLTSDQLKKFNSHADIAAIYEDSVMYALDTITHLNSADVPYGVPHLGVMQPEMVMAMVLIAPSITFGVAKKANLIAVKVLDDDGNGYTSDIIKGLEYVETDAERSGRPSVASLSLGGPFNPALDEAVAKVAAGNSNLPVELFSPAGAPSAITVAASNIKDEKASFSNWGAGVDIFAPGENIISTWIGPSTTEILSGTSMATPHVSGLVASFLSRYGNMNPARMMDVLKRFALNDTLTIGLAYAITPNRLAHSGPV